MNGNRRSIFMILTLLLFPSFVLAGGENSLVSLTEQEKAFLSSNTEIVLGAGASFEPFVIENLDGSYSGYDIDVVNLVAERTGLKIKVETGPWVEIQEKSAARELDGLMTAIFSDERGEIYNKTESYFTSTSLILVKSGNPKSIKEYAHLEGKTIALQTGNILLEGVINRRNLDVDIVYYDSTHELLSAVVAGTVDACVMDEAALYLAKKMGLSSYIDTAFPVGKPYELVFLLRKDWPELTSIFNKGLESIHTDEKLKIRKFWFTHTQESLDYLLIGKLLSVFLLLLVGILIWNYSLKASKREVERALAKLEVVDKELKAKNIMLESLSVTDHLTQLFNRTRLDETLESEIDQASRYSRPFGLIMIDIDLFKAVNDSYGHQVGDQVLIELSNVLKTNSRKVDTVGRWGGEEFLIICPSTDSRGLLALAEKLRVKIGSYNFSTVGHKTASLGVTIYESGDTSHKMVARADEALYIAKRDGRNLTRRVNSTLSS